MTGHVVGVRARLEYGAVIVEVTRRVSKLRHEMVPVIGGGVAMRKVPRVDLLSPDAEEPVLVSIPEWEEKTEEHTFFDDAEARAFMDGAWA